MQLRRKSQGVITNTKQSWVFATITLYFREWMLWKNFFTYFRCVSRPSFAARLRIFPFLCMWMESMLVKFFSTCFRCFSVAFSNADQTKTHICREFHPIFFTAVPLAWSKSRVLYFAKVSNGVTDFVWTISFIGLCCYSCRLSPRTPFGYLLFFTSTQ